MLLSPYNDGVRVADFDFHLPPDLIAQHPPAERDGGRMLAMDKVSGVYQHLAFRDLPSLIRPGDLLVLNDSRVIPARLFGRRAGLRTQANSPSPSGTVEVLLTQSLGENTWRALVKPGRKVSVGERLLFESAARWGRRAFAYGGDHCSGRVRRAYVAFRCRTRVLCGA